MAHPIERGAAAHAAGPAPAPEAPQPAKPNVLVNFFRTVVSAPISAALEYVKKIDADPDIIDFFTPHVTYNASPPSNSEINTSLTGLSTKINGLKERIPADLFHSVKNENLPPLPEEAEPHAEPAAGVANDNDAPIAAPPINNPQVAVNSELEARTALVQNLINFSTLTTFDQIIFGNKPSSTLEFYKCFANKKTRAQIETIEENAQREIEAIRAESPHSERIVEIERETKELVGGPALRAYYLRIADTNAPIEPIKAYYAYLEDTNTLFYFLARMLMPIIKWFIALVLAPSEDLDSGINSVKTFLFRHLSDENTVKTHIVNFFKEAGDYFRAMHDYHSNFDKNQATLNRSLDDYIDNQLAENLNTRVEGLKKKKNEKSELDGERYLHEKFNVFIANIINIKSGIPLIGPLLDKILKFILLRIIQALNIIPMIVNTTFEGSGFNLTLQYNLKALLANELRKLEKQIKATQPKEYQVGEEVLNTFAADSFTERQRSYFKAFVLNLFKFLPLANVTPENLHATLSTTRVLLYFDSKLRDSLIAAMPELAVLLIRTYSDRESTLDTWTLLLNKINNLFDSSKDAGNKNQADIVAINKVLSEATDAVITTALETHLREIPHIHIPKEVHKRANQLINNIHHGIRECTKTLQHIQKLILRECETKEILLIEKYSFHMLLKLNDHITAITNALNNALDCLPNEKTKGKLKIAILTITDNFNAIVQEYERLQDALREVKKHKALEDSLIIPIGADLPPSDTTTIYKGIALERFTTSFGDLRRDRDAISEDKKDILNPCIGHAELHIQKINECNQRISMRVKCEKALLNIHIQLDPQIQTWNKRLLYRPRGEECQRLKADLLQLANPFDFLLQPNRTPLETHKKRLEKLIDSFREVKEALAAHYLDALTPSSKAELNLYLTRVEEHITPFVTLINSNGSELVLAGSIKEYQASNSKELSRTAGALLTQFEDFEKRDQEDHLEIAKSLHTLRDQVNKLTEQGTLLTNEDSLGMFARCLSRLERANSEKNPELIQQLTIDFRTCVCDERRHNNTQIENTKREKGLAQIALQTELEHMDEIIKGWLTIDWNTIKTIDNRILANLRTINEIEEKLPEHPSTIIEMACNIIPQRVQDVCLNNPVRRRIQGRINHRKGDVATLALSENSRHLQALFNRVVLLPIATKL